MHLEDGAGNLTCVTMISLPKWRQKEGVLPIAIVYADANHTDCPEHILGLGNTEEEALDAAKKFLSTIFIDFDSGYFYSFVMLPNRVRIKRDPFTNTYSFEDISHV